MTMTTFLTLFAAGMFLHVLLKWRLVKFIEPQRLEMADLGERLCLDSTLPKKLRDDIPALLDQAYSPWFMAASVVVLPFVFIDLTIQILLGKKQAAPRIDHPETDRDYDRLMTLFIYSTAAANPFCALVVAVWIVALLTLAIFIASARLAFLDVLRTAFRREARLTSSVARQFT